MRSLKEIQDKTTDPELKELLEILRANLLEINLSLRRIVANMEGKHQIGCECQCGAGLRIERIDY